MPHQAPSEAKTRSRLPMLLGAFTVSSLLAGVLLAGMVLPAAGAAGLMTKDGISMFNNLDVQLEDMPLPEGSTMYANDGKTVLARFYEENRVVTPLNKIAPVMRQAVVAIEDSRFYEHGGVDPKGLLRAFVNNKVNDGRTQGASTLTQQYVKNVLLESATIAGDKDAANAATAKTGARKIREIRMAITYEREHSKDEILEGYLNIANFGRNNYGVEAAAQYFFQTTAAKLNLAQAALLAGTVQSPEAYNPFRFPKAATTRRAAVLNRMLALGMITQAQAEAANKVALPTTPKRALSGCVNAGVYAYFCDYTIKMLSTDPRYAVLGKTEKDRLNAIKRGGLKIVTTVDPKLQAAATAALMKKIPADDASGVATSSVTVEPGTGNVLTIAQNKYFSPEKRNDSTELNFGVDAQYGGAGGFQVGSTFKPFVLATWLRKNKGLYTSVNADVKTRAMSEFTACGKSLAGPAYSYDNAEGGGAGSMTVLEATYKSVNTAYISMATALDYCDIADTAQSLGVHMASSEGMSADCYANGVYQADKLPTQCPSMALGAIAISPLTMANAYATFAADGTYCPPTPVKGVTDRAGKAMAIGKTQCKANAIDENVARGVNFTLQNAFTRGTAIGRGISWPDAGKTGTTDNSVRTWFVGYTRQRATAVVVADPKTYPNHPGGRSLNFRKIGGTYYGRVYGATIAAAEWQTIMKAAMSGLPQQSFSKPSGKILEGSGIRIASVVGRSIGSATAVLQGQGFKVRIGSAVPSYMGSGQVARQSPSGGRLEKGSTVTIYPGDGSQQPPVVSQPTPAPQPSDGGNGNGGNGNGGGGNNGGGNNGGNNGGGNNGNGNNGGGNGNGRFEQ